jgi:hypothetical protein
VVVFLGEERFVVTTDFQEPAEKIRALAEKVQGLRRFL